MTATVHQFEPKPSPAPVRTAHWADGAQPEVVEDFKRKHEVLLEAEKELRKLKELLRQTKLDIEKWDERRRLAERSAFAKSMGEVAEALAPPQSSRRELEVIAEGLAQRIAAQ
jgi:chromosome segregation and condensation protein ScpB